MSRPVRLLFLGLLAGLCLAVPTWCSAQATPPTAIAARLYLPTVPAPLAGGAATLAAEPPMAAPGLAPGHGLLVVRTVAGARVLIDGKPARSVTSGDGALVEAGTRRLTIERSGYRPWHGERRVRAGVRNQLRIALEPLPTGFLVVRSNVAGDRVLIDGRAVGASGPRPHRLLPGRHQVRVEKRGRRPYTTTVVVQSGRRTTVRASLKPAHPARLVVRSNVSGDRVLIDGRPVGSTGPRGFELAPGKHRVRVEKRGYKAWEATVQLSPKERRTLRARLRRTG